MRASTNLFLLAAAGTHVFAQDGEGKASTVCDMQQPLILSDSVLTIKQQDAPEVTNNPAGVVYTAVLPDEAFNTATFPDGGNIKGSVSAVAGDEGRGVQFTVKFSNLPKTGGPFGKPLSPPPPTFPHSPPSQPT
jgi:hypothetical protein